MIVAYPDLTASWQGISPACGMVGSGSHNLGARSYVQSKRCHKAIRPSSSM